MRSQVTRKKISATAMRNLRTLLLVSVFDPESIGARIAQARNEAGLRQVDLADLLSVSGRSVQGYELGEVIPFKYIAKISEITNRSERWLLHGDDEAATPSRRTPDEAETRLLVREEVEAALVQVETLLEQLLRRVPPESPADGLGG